MKLALVGLSHKTAPVELRERLALADAAQRRLLARLLEDERVFEAVIVSTCNRSEFYFVLNAEADAEQLFFEQVADEVGLTQGELREYLYILGGEPVVRHLFRVAASLDSMVVGEAQILGQLKDSYDLAFDCGATARVFNKLFRNSFEVGKRVRSETNIGSSAVSISYAAVELAKRVFDTLEGRRVLLLGAGEMSELTALHLQSSGCRQVLVANRTLARAEELATKFDGEALPFEERYEALKQVDIVVSATSADDYVIVRDELAPVVARRRDPLFFIDIAVPRDIDPACASFPNVYVNDVDALDGVIAANLEERKREMPRAEGIVEEEIINFERWLEQMEVEPTIAALREQAQAIRAAELARAYKHLGDLSDEDRATVDKLTQSIVNRMLHGPTSHLREASDGRRGVAAVETARYLFDLQEEEDAYKGFRLIKTLLGKRPGKEAQQ